MLADGLRKINFKIMGEVLIYYREEENLNEKEISSCLGDLSLVNIHD